LLLNVLLFFISFSIQTQLKTKWRYAYKRYGNICEWCETQLLADKYCKDANFSSHLYGRPVLTELRNTAQKKRKREPLSY
jgi:hypothetical protein